MNHQQIQNQDQLLNGYGSHNKIEARKKLYFMVVESSNKYSGVENHYSIEGKTTLKVVKQTKNQSRMSNKIKSQKAKLEEYKRKIEEKQRELQKADKRMQQMASDHKDEYQKLQAQQITLTYWLQQKHKQMAKVSYKYEQLKRSVDEKYHSEQQQQKNSGSKVRPKPTLTTMPSQLYSSQTFTSPTNRIVQSARNERQNNPENISENFLIENQGKLEALTGYLSVGRGDLKAIKKHNSQITGQNEREKEEEKPMTRSAGRQTTDHGQRKTQNNIVIKKALEEHKNKPKVQTKKQQPKTQKLSIQKQLLNENEQKKQRKDSRAMLITAAIIVLIMMFLLGANHLGVFGQL